MLFDITTTLGIATQETTNGCKKDTRNPTTSTVSLELIMHLEEPVKINDPNMKLLLVDLEVSGMDSNGDAIVSIGALIWNAGNLNIPTLTEDGWIYGYAEGACADNAGYGEVDAAIILENDIMFQNFPTPAPGILRRYTNVTTVGPLTPTDYRMENDPLDNLMDYQIFYATTAVGSITPDTRCLSYDIEMPFYRQQYNLVIDTLESHYDLELVGCQVDGITPDGSENIIQHNFTIYLGHVWYVNVGVPYEIDNILAY